MGRFKLDEIDWAILAHLQRDGRVTNKRLAACVGLAGSSCSERVKRLERAGIISGYRAILDWTMLGASFDAWAEVEVAARSGADNFHQYVCGFASIVSAHRTVQPHVFLLHVVAESTLVWREFLAAAESDGFTINVMRLHVMMECVKPPSASFGPLIRRVA